MTGINRTSNALWRDPIPAVADSKPVKLSPERWTALRDHLAGMRRVPHDEPQQVDEITLHAAVEIAGVTFLPAVYRAA